MKSEKNLLSLQIALAVLALVTLLLVVIIAQPAQFSVVRTAIIKAPAAVIFKQLNDLHKWEAWSPWAKLDPAAAHSYAGPQKGLHASLHWAGNNKVGEGTMTIITSHPPELLQLKLEFVKPFEAVNLSQFQLEPEGKDTKVTWSMEGRKNFIGKAIGLLMNCEKMVGAQLSRDLPISHRSSKNARTYA